MGRPLSKIKFEPAPDREEFERQPNESAKAWKAFLIYRELGYTRTIRKAADEYRKSTGTTTKLDSINWTFEKWSTKWGWQRRIEAWDRELDRQRRKVEYREVQEMRKRHIKLAHHLQALGANELKKWLKKSEHKLANDEALTIRELLKTLDEGVRLERTTRGEPETILEERRQISVDEERKALRVLLGDTEALEAVDSVLDKVNEDKP